ncbi:LamG domain-containing protein, partial [Rhodospirillales bacterium]|nr:LamG domain-containing protein [Rhodospirillales bacterium]
RSLRTQDRKRYLFGVHADNTVRLLMSSDQSGEVSITSTLSILSNQWVHVAVTADRSGEATFYINGVADGGGRIDSIPDSLTQDTSLLIGNTDTTGSTWTGWDGMIADVRLWDDVRTAAEIGGNNFGPQSSDAEGLVGNWPLDDPIVTGEAADYSGYGNIGT